MPPPPPTPTPLVDGFTGGRKEPEPVLGFDGGATGFEGGGGGATGAGGGGGGGGGGVGVTAVSSCDVGG